MRKLLFITCVLGISIQLEAGGGWPQKKGGYFMKVGSYSIFSPYYALDNRSVIDIPPAGYFSLNVYGEYGITDKLTGIMNAPLFTRSFTRGNSIDPAEAINSIGDFDLGAKYNFLDKDGWVSSAALFMGIPLGNPSGGNSGMLQTGDGEFNQLAEVYLSKSLGKGYFTATTGINNRTNGFSDEFRFGLEGGRKFGGFWGILRVYGVESFENGTKPYEQTYGIFTNNIEYLGVSPEISYEFKEKWGLVMGAGFAAYARNILANPSVSFGVYFKN